MGMPIGSGISARDLRLLLYWSYGEFEIILRGQTVYDSEVILMTGEITTTTSQRQLTASKGSDRPPANI